MNQQEAEQFVQDLFLRVWEHRSLKDLKNYYSADLVGHFQKETFGLEDVVNRMQYVQKRYSYLRYHVKDVVLVDKVIIACVRQSGVDNVLHQYFNEDVIAVYQLRNDLIVEAWLLIDEHVDYFATIGTEKGKENITIDERSKRHFMELMQDREIMAGGKSIRLTPREQETIYYFLNGYTAKEIGKMLGLSYRTIQVYLANVKQKFNCSTKQALRQKLLDEWDWF